MKTLEQKIAVAQAELARLHKKARSESRRADAHNKIQLGGLVIAAGLESLNPAELLGWLLAVHSNRTEATALEASERGFKKFEAMEAAKEQKRQAASGRTV